MAPELDFRVLGAEPLAHCVTPTIALRLAITNRGAEPVHSVGLSCQVRIEAQRRRYEGAERERLFDLFDASERWAQTLRSLLWTRADVNVGAFSEATEVDLLLPCTYDFNVLAARYLHALEDGLVPLVLLFSGTVFFSGPGGGLQVVMVPWDREAEFELPVATWKSMMDLYYPNAAWLCLRRDTFDRLAAYKSRRGIATWDQALDSVLEVAEETAAP